jgi:hypothetical protein
MKIIGHQVSWKSIDWLESNYGWTNSYDTMNIPVFIFYLMTFSETQIVVSNYRMAVNNKLEMARKEAVAAWFKPLSRNLLGVTEENHEDH